MLEAETDDWEVETAESGEAALRLLLEEDIDVVVSDMRMPGMDGARLLDEISVRHPRVLRVVLSGQADRETVLRAVKPMHQYLSKPCDSQSLIDIIAKAKTLQATIASAEVLEAIGRKNCLPSLPDFVLRLNSALENENATTKTIAKIISQDPSTCAKVLQLANSAIFGLRRPVVDLEHGISVVGVEMIRSLALSQAVFSNETPVSSISAEKISHHCFEVALLARQICAKLEGSNTMLDTAFTGGLLHDIGKIILTNAFPERYSKIVQSTNDGYALSQAEMQEFGATHQGIGAYILDLWGLPKEIVEVVASHHDFCLSAASSASCQGVFIANWLFNGADDTILKHFIEEQLDDGTELAFRDRMVSEREVFHDMIQGEVCDV